MRIIQYFAQVSSEAPRFKTVEASTDLTVIHPPPSPPHLTKPVPGGRYRVGDMFELNCSSPASSPPAKLRYFINNQMVIKLNLVDNEYQWCVIRRTTGANIKFSDAKATFSLNQVFKLFKKP